MLAQEIRNCVYQGPLNTLLFELNEDSSWRSLFGAGPDPRMRDMEFVLRLFAMRTQFVLKHPKGNISHKKLLNDFMGSPENSAESALSELSSIFSKTMKFISEFIGENAFYNIVQGDPSKIRKRFYPTVFDSISAATSIAITTLGDSIPKEGLEGKRLEMLQDEDYRKFISEGTMQAEHIQGRIAIATRYLYGFEPE